MFQQLDIMNGAQPKVWGLALSVISPQAVISKAFSSSQYCLKSDNSIVRKLKLYGCTWRVVPWVVHYQNVYVAENKFEQCLKSNFLDSQRGRSNRLYRKFLYHNYLPLFKFSNIWQHQSSNFIMTELLDRYHFFFSPFLVNHLKDSCKIILFVFVFLKHPRLHKL